MKKENQKILADNSQLDSNMLVAIRIRPLDAREQKQNDFSIVSCQDKMLVVLDKKEVECESEERKPDVLHRSREQRYYFDRIFDETVDTESVYKRTCTDLIDSVLKGFNGCVFAYGTTGSGKTHTMNGNPSSPGITYLMIQDIFERIRQDTQNQYDIKVSYVEIYNEVIRDLLIANKKNNYLDLREDGDKIVCIAGVTEFRVKDPKQVMSLLTIGNKRRTTEATNVNQTSSRSHAIFQIQLESKDRTKNTEEEVTIGKLSLIDLAGSERGTVTENRGIRLREGAKINTSLLALANCINALGDKSKKGFFVPFRDSKLTRMLKDSLGGNCKTVMIVTISPASSQNEETINTLKYANRAKNIKMKVQANKKMVVQHISAYKNIIADLRDEIENLKCQLAADMEKKARSTKFGAANVIQAVEDGEDESLEKLIQGAQNAIDGKKENAFLKDSPDEESKGCVCPQRRKDEEQKEEIQQDIDRVYEDIIQLEKALVELDEQNTVNALEIRKKEAKTFLLEKQIEEYAQEGEEKENSNKYQNEVAFLQKHINQLKEQIETLQESTKQNLLRRQQKKDDLLQCYQEIKLIRQTIDERIQSEEVKNYLELIIKNNFLESQNLQLVLNLQLQSRTIQDQKIMIQKQQQYIEENCQNGQGQNMDILFFGGQLDFENEETPDGEYISDFPTNEKPPESVKPTRVGQKVMPQSAKQDPKKEGFNNVGNKMGKKPPLKKK